MKVRDLILKAFRTARILGAGEPLESEEASDAFDVLNAIVEEINIDKTLAYYHTTISFPLVNNQATYTIGPASTVPNVVAPRPVEILSAFSRRGNVDLPIYLLSLEDYNLIQQKDIGIAGWEQVLYYEATYPKGTIYVYQKPLDDMTSVFLDVTAEMAAFDSLDTDLSLPPGYRYWMQYKLAERLCPEYGRIFSESLKTVLTEAQAAVKNNNIKPLPIAKTGLSALTNPSGGKYNVYSDTSRR